MNALNVRIITMEPMRMASFRGFGESPELEAWGKLFAWALDRGLFVGPARPRILGFNNPHPTPDSPVYGYEFWIELAPDATPGSEEQLTVETFEGGRFAVVRCQGAENISSTWRALLAWCEASPYRPVGGHLYEALVAPLAEDLAPEDLVLDLLLPVAGPEA